MQFFKGESPPFRGVAYRPDGRTLVTATQGGGVTLWDLEAGRELARLKGKPGPPYRIPHINAMVLSPDGRLLATAGPDVTVWDLDTGELATGFDSSGIPTFRGIVFALGGTRLVAGAGNIVGFTFRGFALLEWNTADGGVLPVLHTSNHHGLLTTTPDGESILGEASNKNKVVRWHLPTGQEHATGFQPPPCSLAASPAGVVAQGIYRAVEIRDPTGARLLARWEAHKKGVFALAFSADGKLLATGSGDEFVKVWDVSGVVNDPSEPGAPPLTAVPEVGAYEWSIGPVRAIAFSPDGLTAAAVGDRVKFVVWDVE
jgi:WD40 repeat protein